MGPHGSIIAKEERGRFGASAARAGSGESPGPDSLVNRPQSETFITETGFLLARGPDLVRAPDVAYVAAERLTGVDMDKYLPLAPDLAVEVVSPGDTAAEVDAKARMWVAYGSRLVWVAFPDERVVHVYRPDRPRAELTAADTLSGEDLLPGFTLPVSDFL